MHLCMHRCQHDVLQTEFHPIYNFDTPGDKGGLIRMDEIWVS